VVRKKYSNKYRKTMRIDRKARKRLVLERQDRIKQSVHFLYKGDLEGTKEHIEWINTSSQILDLQKDKQKYYWATIIAVISILVVGLSFTLRISNTTSSLELYVDGVVLSLQDEWRTNSEFISDSFYMNNLYKVYTEQHPIELAEQTSEPENFEAFDMRLDGHGIKLKELRINNDAEIELEIDKDQLKIYAKNAQLSGRFSIKQGKVVINYDERIIENINDRPPSTISFKTIATSYDSDPIRIDLSNNIFWEFLNLKINSINFIQEYPPNSGIFESTIDSGKIILNETAANIDLRKEESLIIDIEEIHRLAINGKNDKIHIYFEGVLSKIVVGPRGYERNLKPTYLGYIYHNQRLALFWSAVVFIWGLLWSIRNTLFKGFSFIK